MTVRNGTLPTTAGLINNPAMVQDPEGGATRASHRSDPRNVDTCDKK